MLLTSLEIENFRSLEHVKLDSIDSINVLIGRNNAGKTSVFHALQTLRDRIIGGAGIALEPLLTDREVSRTWCMTLEFNLLSSERDKILSSFEPLFQGDKRRFDTVKSSPFLSGVRFRYEFPGNELSDRAALKVMEILAETGGWATIWQFSLINGQYRALVSNPIARVDKSPFEVIREGSLASNTGRSDVQEYALQAGQKEIFGQITNHPVEWFIKLLFDYLTSSFFFSPHRRSIYKQTVTEVSSIDTSGSNLPQVLHTVYNNYPGKFHEVAAFIKEAISDIGDLRVRLSGAETFIAFEPMPTFQTHLHDMGGGVEQLLMVATALQTSRDHGAIFLEEPENHLHPSALRYLFDKLRRTQRQIFAATHEAVLLNDHMRDTRIFRVEKVAGRTRISRATKSEELSEVLREIGIRNSDVLMADAVLFVEGPYDDPVLLTWAKTLGINLLGRGISIVHMGGSESIKSSGTIRQQTLEKISAGSPVPHLFIIDRDQRSDNEVAELRHKLMDKIHVLEKRELENYFLHATDAIWKVLLMRGGETANKLQTGTPRDLSDSIMSESKNLFNEVLVKRIRAELGGLKSGFIPRDDQSKLFSEVDSENFVDSVWQLISTHITRYVSKEKVADVIQIQRKVLEEEWKDSERILQVVPGADVLERVFKLYGATFHKGTDGERIAQNMRQDDISDEIKQLLHHVHQLTQL